jgi:hypothetical protein
MGGFYMNGSLLSLFQAKGSPDTYSVAFIWYFRDLCFKAEGLMQNSFTVRSLRLQRQIADFCPLGTR